MSFFLPMQTRNRRRAKYAAAGRARYPEAWRIARRDPPLSPLCLRGAVAAGFPSQAEESLCDTLSLDDLLIGNREATFLLRVSGDSMIGAGIMPGDMVLVDRSLTAKNGDIVVAEVDGQWTMKHLRRQGESAVLVAANPRYPPIRPRRELKIAGVVTGVVRKYL